MGDFWTGGITKSAVSHRAIYVFTFHKGLDDKQTDLERNAEFLGIEVEKIFDDEQQNLDGRSSNS